MSFKREREKREEAEKEKRLILNSQLKEFGMVRMSFKLNIEFNKPFGQVTDMQIAKWNT